MRYIRPADFEREADQRYWQDVVRFRWVVVVAYFSLTAAGVLPHRMPWFFFAAATLVGSTIAYTIYRRTTSAYTRYQDIAGGLDILTISLILITIGTIDHPIWVAYALVIPSVANFKRQAYNAAFTVFVVASFLAVYFITDVIGDGDYPVHMVVVTSVLLALVALNEAMISANNFRLREVIRSQAMTDPLTQLPNRRRLFEALETYEPGDRKLAVMMMDLDDFKVLNESLGHLTADRILAQVGEVLLEQAPEAALPARYGGDEFAMLVEVGECAEAEALAERIIDAAMERVGIGLTIGIATHPCEAETPERALHMADNNLRRAKAAGKQRVLSGDAA